MTAVEIIQSDLVAFPPADPTWQVVGGSRSHYMMLVLPGSPSLLTYFGDDSYPSVAQVYLGQDARYYIKSSVLAPKLATGDLTDKGKALLSTLLDTYPGAQVRFSFTDSL